MFSFGKNNHSDEPRSGDRQDDNFDPKRRTILAGLAGLGAAAVLSKNKYFEEDRAAELALIIDENSATLKAMKVANKEYLDTERSIKAFKSLSDADRDLLSRWSRGEAEVTSKDFNELLEKNKDSQMFHDFVMHDCFGKKPSIDELISNKVQSLEESFTIYETHYNNFIKKVAQLQTEGKHDVVKQLQDYVYDRA